MLLDKTQLYRRANGKDRYNSEEKQVGMFGTTGYKDFSDIYGF